MNKNKKKMLIMKTKVVLKVLQTRPRLRKGRINN
jgi:hypothetical protein